MAKQVYHLCLVWTRDDYGEQQPSTAFCATSESELFDQLANYLRNWMNLTVLDHHEIDEINDVIENNRYDSPELDCMYETYFMIA